MTNVCDMSNFPTKEFFDQHLLPSDIPSNYDYEYTRLFGIWAEATVDQNTGPLKELVVSMRESTFSSNIPGTPKQVRPWEDIAEEALRSVGLAARNPLDFALWRESRVILLLEQPFWYFSPVLAALTTKHDYAGQYFDLRRHAIVNDTFVNVSDAEWRMNWSAEPSSCISFYTKEPCRDWQLGGGSPKVQHGFSLNLQVPMNGGQQLPITIDPDIENKGGHP